VRKWVVLLTVPLVPLVPRAVPAHAAGGGCERSAALVAEFAGAYRDAVLDRGDTGRTPSEVRALYLTPELNARLDRWAAAHPGADPVFHEPVPPVGWTLRCAAAGRPGLVDLVEQKPDGGSHPVRYTVRTADPTITGLADPAGLDH